MRAAPGQIRRQPGALAWGKVRQAGGTRRENDPAHPANRGGAQSGRDLFPLFDLFSTVDVAGSRSSVVERLRWQETSVRRVDVQSGISETLSAVVAGVAAHAGRQWAQAGR